MRVSLIQFIAFATAALAQTPGFDVFSSPNSQSSWKVGDVLPIAWTPSMPAGKITLTLIGGSSSSNLAPVLVIAQSIDSTPGTFSWPIPPNIGTFASYGVNLTLDSGSDFQYSSQFYITGGSSNPASYTATGTASDTTTTQTTRMTSTITVANTTMTTSASVTGSMSNNLTMTATPTKATTSSTSSVTATGTGGATPVSSKSAGEGLRARVEGATLVGMGAVLMAFLL
ncbi:hypothetical protein NA56DRAFT_692130 [Hyaloscypha hepaticicola]|uniref:Yeast cell wall synthesis Kre9/Knh1-like N-terminal domain-containing protein n=1 Tax=Hyaloscypha hepaticicola TaxID=2082293 RepID=A0A2J6PT57_9HELO|nr:hypothetical protein NA56DRAFT_692130 [Hyaloscypha hepaticicola]